MISFKQYITEMPNYVSDINNGLTTFGKNPNANISQLKRSSRGKVIPKTEIEIGNTIYDFYRESEFDGNFLDGLVLNGDLALYVEYLKLSGNGIQIKKVWQNPKISGLYRNFLLTYFLAVYDYVKSDNALTDRGFGLWANMAKNVFSDQNLNNKYKFQAQLKDGKLIDLTTVKLFDKYHNMFKSNPNPDEFFIIRKR